METKLLKSNEIDEAISLLRNGEIVALPTETVYGLAADAKNDLAVQKIFNAKNRPSSHPLIVHIDSFDKTLLWAKNIPDAAKILAEHFWPGPLTMLFNKNTEVSDLITGGLQTIALRVPKHQIMLEVLKKFGSALAAPSANPYQKISPTKAEHVMKGLYGKISAVLDGGDCSVGLESTIIDMTCKVPRILRPGAITTSMIENILGIHIETPEKHNEKISGNMKTHYQPDTPAFIMSLDEIKSQVKVQNNANIAIMHYSELQLPDSIKSYPMSGDKENYARKMYGTLHIIDNAKVDKILIEQPPINAEWSDINDRLSKAASN